MSKLVLYDDAAARDFEPFALTRPVSELRAGVPLIRQRWETALGVSAIGFIAPPHLDDFEEAGSPGAFLDSELPAGTLIANARALPALESLGDGGAWTIDSRLAALRLTRPTPTSALRTAGAELESLIDPITKRVEIDGRWINAPWDLIRYLPEMLSEDILRVGPTLQTANPKDATVLRGHPVFAELGATIEPHVLLDASTGPILVRRGSHIRGFTRLMGPCAIGPNTIVLGERVAASSIGEDCRVHGEVSNTIFIGHANKAHGGFIGHCVLGRWVNLGASTVNSNLKNTYGNVSMWTPHGAQDTGMQFLGTLMGDHSKTGIGTRLTTGSVIGAGANVVYDGLAPKTVPPFTWGPGEQVYDLERFVQVVERVLARRNVTLGARMRRQLAAAHAKRWRS